MDELGGRCVFLLSPCGLEGNASRAHRGLMSTDACVSGLTFGRSATQNVATMFFKAVQEDSKTTETSLVILNRVMIAVSFTVVVIALVVMNASQPLSLALSRGFVLGSDADRALLHSVRRHYSAL